MSKEQFYRFEPYCNRSDGTPSWQWDFLQAAATHRGRVALGGNRIGKPICATQEVPMADGTIKKLCDVKIGDYVLCYDIKTQTSYPVAVLDKVNNGILESYRVTFSDGASIEAAGEHPFPVRLGSGKSKAEVTKKTLDELKGRINNSVSKRTRMLSPKEVRFNSIERLEIHPYAMGVFLGDGSINKSFIVTSKDEDVIDRAYDGIKHLVDSIKKREQVNNKSSGFYFLSEGKRELSNGQYLPSKLRQAFDKLGLIGKKSDNKFIPNQYLTASIEDRMQLLAGLIDTDGYKYGFTVKSKQLAQDFARLVRSLGGKATLQTVQKTCTNAPQGPKTGTYYNVYWKIFDVPAIHKHKLPEPTKRQPDYTSRIVRKIEPIGKQECYCILVDHPDHCFLIGDYIATCNTEIGAYEAALAVTGQHPFKKYPACGTGWIIGLDNAMIRDTDRPKFEKLLPSRFKTKFYKQDNIWLCHADDREWKIVFKSTEMGIDKFQAANINFAWVDEEPKNTDLWQELEARLVDENGNWWLTATPVRGTAWLKSLSEREGVFKTFAGMRENPHIPLEAVEDFARTLTDDERDVRIEGKYIIFGGNPVFDRKLLREMMEQLEKEVIAVETGILQGAA